MRPRRASVSNGVVNRRIRLSHQTILLAILALIAVWMIGSLVQEISLDRSLSHQASELRQQNATIATTNQGYQHDIADVTSGAAAEEEARKDGYARSDEHIYIVGTPPPPTPAPHGPGANAPGGGEGVLHAILRFLTSRPS